nr:serine/arginine repetitive matrix protein 2-like [Ipomoea batatas]
MSDSDSQNISARDYDEAIETTPTGASSASSIGSAGEVGANDGWVGEGGPRRGKSPRVVIAHLHEELPQYSPATRETILANLPPGLRPRKPFLFPIRSNLLPPNLLRPPGNIIGSSPVKFACFPQICARHGVPCTIELFNFIFAVRHIPVKHGGGFLMAQSRGHFCSIPDLSDNNKGWKNRIVSVKYPWKLPVPRVWSEHYTKHKYPVDTRALKNAVVKISAESYEYWVFRSPKTVKAAHLEPPDYSQPEKYVPKRMAGSSATAPAAKPTEQGMVLERSFDPALTGPKKSRPKVTLGGSKAPLTVEAAPAQGSEPTILASSAGAAAVADLQVARATTRRGKEKAMEPEVEENPPLKRQKCTNTRGSTPVLDALLEGGEQTVNFLDKIRTVIPTREAIRDLETDQVGEMIAQNVLWAAENVVRREVAPLKESLAAKDKELTEKVQALEGRIASAEREVEAAKRETAEMNEKMSSYANLTGFLCRNPQEAEAFFWAFIHNEVGEELAWRYGEWAYAKGRYEMQQAIGEALGESLNEKDYSTIMGVMPEPVPAPDPMPYADSTPSGAVPAPTKD